jgi:hypothetical protein
MRKRGKRRWQMRVNVNVPAGVKVRRGTRGIRLR